MTEPTDQQLERALGVPALVGLPQSELMRIVAEILDDLEETWRTAALDRVHGLRQVALEGVDAAATMFDVAATSGTDEGQRLLHRSFEDARAYYAGELARPDASEEYRLHILGLMAQTTKDEQAALSEQREHVTERRSADRKAMLIQQAVDKGVPLFVAFAKIGLQVAASRGLPRS